MSPSIQDYLEQLPGTRKEAREKGVLYYFTGKTCKRGHLAKRFVSDKTCIECRKQWQEANLDKRREKDRRWQEANPDKHNAKEARRRATKKSATPSWANQEEIKYFYTKSKELEQLTGVKHHVDHIYPLKSDFLCGLHVENNLQVLPAVENCSKNNRMWPNQLECQTGSGTVHAWWRELNERIQSPSVSAGLSL